ncbi:MAG: carboxypeptidase-like regulatory domain-containing protein, partial [Candidatus Aminicenantes bacterium]|nr:carboxypeptidase-like regulatory domain-containing protein [Candidatus Aminicenantes bacterium]
MNIRKGAVIVFALAVFSSFFPAGQSNKYHFLKGSLIGVVYNEAGLTVSKAEVAVRGVNYEETLKTDGQGRFNIRKMPTGVYQLLLVSSNPEMAVKKEVAIHLGKESYVSLVMKTKSVSEQFGIIEPVFFRDSEGKVLHQETIIGDRMYSVDYVYDLMGRVSAIRDSFNQEWQYEYTSSGKIRKVIRPDKKTIYYNYDKEDQLVKIDLPWGYKIYYEKKDNQFIKTVTKYKNQVLYRFIYSIDSKGNKVKVDEGSSQKGSFEYIYDGNDRLKAIINTRTGEINSNVVEYKGKVKNGALDGAIENKNGKFQDRNYEYYFDVRGNIVRQKEKRGDAEVQRQFNQRDLLTRETYLYKSAPALTVEYAYDVLDC